MNIDGSADIEGGLFCWSPNGHYMAVITSHSRLVVRDSINLEVIFYELCSSGSAAARTSLITGEEVIIDKVGFSPDSLFVFASCMKAGITHVFQVQAAEPRWKAKITEGVSGLSEIYFTPDSRHLLAFSELNIKLTLWSLVQKKVRYIKYPKNRNCVQFSKDGKYLAVVERRDGHDCLSIFSSSDWGLAHHFEIECSDCAEISWSPHGESICVWSTSLDFSCYVYSLDGHCLFNFVPQTFGLGISTSAWSPCGSILAIASCDGKIRIFNVLNWTLMSELPSLSNTIHHTKALIFEEVEVTVRDVDLRIAKELMSRKPETEYKVIDKRPVHIIAGDRGRNVDHKALRSFKISEFKFCSNSQYLAVKSESVPSTVFVYHVQGLTLAGVIINRFPVISLDWGPVNPYSECLTILTSDGSLHVWSPNGALCLNLPDYDFDSSVEQVHWNPMGKALALSTKDKILCCKVGLNNILDDDT